MSVLYVFVTNVSLVAYNQNDWR